MPGDGVFRRLRRAVQSARRGAFFGPRQGTAGVPELKHTTDGAGRPPLRGASWDGSHVAFMERRLRRDVLVPKVLGAQVAFAAVMVHIGRGGLDFMIATSAAEADLDAESGGAWPWPRGEARVSSRQVAKGPGPVADAAPALVFVFVVAATWFRSRGTALLHTWRTWQAIGPALAVVYTHVVCVASRCPAALARWLDDEDLAEGEDFAENAKLLQSLQSLAFSVRVVAAVAGETLLADCTRLARGLVPRGVTCVCALAAVYSLEMHASHLQGIGSVIVIAGAYAAWILARCDSVSVSERWQAVECLGALVLSSVLSTWRRYQMALERYENIGAIRGETDRLREARGDTKRFMAFLFHEIRVPLSVISLGIPSLRDHVFDLSALNDYNGTDDETLVMEHQHAVETADLMGRSMDVVQRVLGDVLDLLHASTDETSASLSPEWTDLGSLVNTAISASAGMFERGGAVLTPGLPREAGEKLAKIAVLVDPPRLRRALDAILASASGITPPGGVTRVTVEVTPIGAPVDGSVAATAATAAGFSKEKYAEQWTVVDIVLVSTRVETNEKWFAELDVGKIVAGDLRTGVEGGPGLAKKTTKALAPTTTADELLKMLREPLHRAAGAARAPRWSMCDVSVDTDERVAAEALIGDADSHARDRVFAPAAAALDLHVARMLCELHGGEIVVRDVPGGGHGAGDAGGGGTAICIRVPALTCAMDRLMTERARSTGEARAAAGPWNNPFATRIPDSPGGATLRRMGSISRPPSRMGAGATNEQTRDELERVASRLAHRGGSFANESDALRGNERVHDLDAMPRSVRVSRASPPTTNYPYNPAPTFNVAAVATVAAAEARQKSEEARRAARLRSELGALLAGTGSPSHHPSVSPGFHASVTKRNYDASRAKDAAFLNTNNRSFRYENDAPTVTAPAAAVGGAGSPPTLASTETSDGDDRTGVGAPGIKRGSAGDPRSTGGAGKRSRTSSDQETSSDENEHVKNLNPANVGTQNKPPSVLVVEDSVPTRTMLARLLRRLDLEVTEVGNGLEAVRVCASRATQRGGDVAKPFDLILMDKEMPVMDGHEATATLRRNGVTSPIIGITANVLSSDRDVFISHGLSDFLQKPVSRNDFVAVLQKHGLCGCDPFRAADRSANASAQKRQKTPETKTGVDENRGAHREAPPGTGARATRG